MDRNRTKVFVDSNVWFSAFYKKGVASDLIETLLQKDYEIVVSELVLEEIVRNIKNKVPLALSLVHQFFQEYSLTVVKDPRVDEIQKYVSLAQSKDLPILASALNYQCRFFITGNKKDFQINSIKKQYHLSILTPREILSRIR